MRHNTANICYVLAVYTVIYLIFCRGGTFIRRAQGQLIKVKKMHKKQSNENT